MAPLTRRRRKKALAAAPRRPGIDRISNLHPEIQAHILSFLPAQEAVGTCVLARTWRDVWKLTRRLLITGKSVYDVREFVDHLLQVRLDGLEHASLDASEINFDPSEEFGDDDDDDDESEDDGDDDDDIDPSEEFGDDVYCYDNGDIEPYLDNEDTCNLTRWISRVLECQIQMLRVNIDAHQMDQPLSNTLLVSRHLTRLDLRGVKFICSCIDLDGCPELEHLEINECCLEVVRKISSQSLKSLVITSCEWSNDAHYRIQICVPRLVSLLLDDNDLRTPLLERMPELVQAKVTIGSSQDWCSCKDPMDCYYHVMRPCDTSDIDSDNDEEDSGNYAGQNTMKCSVLEGLAQAEDLVLIVDHSKYIFRSDLRWCPTFSKLKTLVLNEVNWQPADYFSALACMLEHAPLLEKLTLILEKVLRGSRKYKVELKGYPDAKEKSTKISQHLQIEINCDNVNERFLSVLSFLGTLNICFEIRVTEK